MANIVRPNSRHFERPLSMRWAAPLHRHRDVPIRNGDGTAGSYILAFAERLLLAEGVEELCQGLRRRNERIKIAASTNHS